jgi:hypothetical protein
MKLHLSTYEEYKKHWNIMVNAKYYACSFCKERKETISTMLCYKSEKMIDVLNRRYNFYIFCNEVCLNCYIMKNI